MTCEEHRFARALVLFFAMGVGAGACSDDTGAEGEDGDDATAGDGAAVGGDSGEGGEGATSTGGTTGRGGAGATGGANATGGSGEGGQSGESGESGVGGSDATGGIGGAGSGAGGGENGGGGTGGSGGGGTGGLGGVAGAGGLGGAGNGGSAGAGGMGGNGPVTCDSVFSVSSDGFVRSPGASGCWHGYAFPGSDSGSVIAPTNYSMCGAGCMLRVSGTLGAATAANNYSGVVFVGFNLNQAVGATTTGSVTPTGTSLQVTYTKVSGPSIVRIQIQSGTTRWCAQLAGSPVNIPYTTFNTECWDGAGSAYAKQPIQSIALIAPGGPAAVPIDMTLVSVKDT